MSKKLTDNLLAKLVNEFDFDINEEKYKKLIDFILANLNNEQGFLHQFKNSRGIKKQILELLNYLVKSTGNYRANSFDLVDEFPTEVTTAPVILDASPFYWIKAENDAEKDLENKLLIALIFFVSIPTLTLPLFALFYLSKQVFESIERLCHAEGSIQALMHISVSLAGGMAAGFLFYSFAFLPLVSLFITAGMANPAVLALVSLIAVSIVGATLSSYLFDLCRDAIFSSVYKDSLDPLEPVLYGLTEEDEQYLTSEGLNPLKVKIALAAQHKMQPKFSSFFRRVFTYEGGEEQAILNDIRKLKRGVLSDFSLYDSSGVKLNLDLKSESVALS